MISGEGKVQIKRREYLYSGGPSPQYNIMKYHCSASH